MKRYQKKHGGFTLLEVLVALGILGMALGAITQSIGSTINNVSYLRDKTFAHWVGMNRIAELRSNGKWPSVGSSDGSEMMGNHEWFWKESVSPLNEQFKSLRRVEIEVRSKRNDKKALVSLMTVIGEP
ncbi:MAG: type II secretion system minor pseudopilin GspI [Gammaproteobacteria bacterium]|nr:type II secretion system minor pseudopilin GspI [Gammaproteobacteria bacterium]